MLIIGVDPGTIVTGYGIIDAENNSFRHILNGAVKLPASETMPGKLGRIYDTLQTIIKKHKPDEFALETAFYGRNVQSALKIGYARGAAMLVAVQNNIPVHEYSPREVKKSVTGSGAATKEQVAYMINTILELRSKIEKLDESDALAVALCHAFRLLNPVNSKASWKQFIRKYPERIINS